MTQAEAERQKRVSEAGREGGLEFWAFLVAGYQRDGFKPSEIAILTGCSPFEQNQLVTALVQRQSGSRKAFSHVRLRDKGL